MLAVGLWNGPHLWRLWSADYLTATGEQTEVRLPDGSRMVLNTASAVSIDFQAGRREVHLLEGEAWFEVQSDPAHPFRVTGHYGAVTVTGTRFAVRLDDDRDTVVLEQGRVEVAGLAPGQAPIALAPDQMVSIGSAGSFGVTPTDPAMALAWREGRVIFDEAPLSRVIEELQRYRGGKTLLLAPARGRMLVSGNYRLDDIDTAIGLLAATAGLQLTRLPGKILILR